MNSSISNYAVWPWRVSLTPYCARRWFASLFRFVLLFAAVHPWDSLCQNASPAPDAAKVQDARDKIQRLNDAVINSTSALNLANNYASELKSLADPSSDKGDFIARAQTINEKLKTIIGSNLQRELADRGAAIKTATDAMPTCDKTTLGSDVAEMCTKATADAQTRQSDLDGSKTSLGDALNGIGPYFKTSLDDPSKQLDQLDTMWSSPNDLPADVFATSIPTFTKSCSAFMSVSQLKSSVYALLTTLKADTTTSSDVDTVLKSLSDKLKAESLKVDAILVAIQKTAEDKTKKVSDSVTAVAATPIASAQAASDAATEASKAVRGMVTALTAWPDLEADIKSCGGGDLIHLAKLREGIKALQSSKATLQEKLSILNDALVGDPNQFTEEAVPLFFYTEVEKLMRSLNERTDWAGGNSAAATVAASQRELLLDAESRVTQARGEVADLQFELAKLQEQKRQADAATSLLALQSQKASVTKKSTDSNLTHATDEFNQAQAESEADPTNAAKSTRLQKATEKKNTATAKATDATAKESDAKTKVSDAQAQQTAASADKDSLTARIDLATSKLGDAQRNMEEMQRSAYRAALTESDAFAAARDQTPYLDGPALSTSPDPVKRVIMRGYPDRNLILLRGKPEDIAVVKRVIAAFDIPAPQARLTLWSFEISAELSKGFLWFKKPADRLNDATAIVDHSLSVTRTQIADAKTSLRESVNKGVSEAETGGITAASVCTQLDMPQELYARLIPSEQARWRRFRYYTPAALIQAGVNMWSADSFKNAVLPDPAATTTVGEALMVLALSCEKNRNGSYRNFQAQTGKCFKGTAQVLGVPPACSLQGDTTAQQRDALDEREKALDERTRKLEEERSKFDKERSELTENCKSQLKDCQDHLGASGAQPTSMEQCSDPKINGDFGLIDEPNPVLIVSEGITDMQLEIVRALRAGATKKILRDLQSLRDQIGKPEEDYHNFRSQRSSANFTSSQVRECKVRVSAIESLYNRYNRLVNTRFRILYPTEFRDFQLVPDREDFAIHVKLQSAQAWQKIAEAGPRVAAADEMLKVMMGRLEDDLDGEYIQPMLKNVRRELVKQGLTVGIVQRTSVLATNRLKARVDPKGMYDLSVGEQQDLLAGIGQLASIYMSAQTGGPLAAFGSLNSLNQKQEQHIYGVTSGNKFEVTPIFDPSGQALRFKFDYVSNSLVRNPKGTVDPSMPSIRHTVNTEVQLSNLEIREISRYESSAKLGIPTRYSGGIPILTDIPGLKPIPLIGWFVRRGGSNAEVQQSVIFGQTAIYPTIGSIVELLQTGN